MTNYKQPHKPMTTIEEIVETNNDWIAKVLFAKPGKDTEKAVSDHSTWLTQTLKDYGDAREADTRRELIKEIEGMLPEMLVNSPHTNVYEENQTFIVMTDYKKTVKSVLKKLKIKLGVKA